MDASRIVFSQQTKAALNARPMSKAAKAKLRRERVKDYIRSQPVGTIIKQRDLATVAGYDKSQGHGWAFISRMVKTGHIAKDTSEGNHKPSWTVRGDAKVKTPPVEKPEKLTVESNEKPEFSLHTESLDDLNDIVAGMVTQRAKEFAWAYNSDSLRDFIRFLSAGANK